MAAPAADRSCVTRRCGWCSATNREDLERRVAAGEAIRLIAVDAGVSESASYRLVKAHMIPGVLTIKDAAAPESSLKFLLVGAAVLVPTILAYTGYAYWVFRGKVDPEEGYH